MDKSSDQVFIQGHRGCRGLLPENSIPAFEKAVSLGVSCLELDVVISGDNSVFVSHEPFFNAEICTLPSGEPFSAAEGEAYQIYSMRSDSVKLYPCGNISHPRFPEQEQLKYSKPLLKELFQDIKAYCKAQNVSVPKFNIELKNRKDWYGTIQPQPKVFAELVIDAIEAEEMKDLVMIQSFDMNMLKAIRDISEDYELVILNEKPEVSLSELIRELGFTPDVYSPEYILVDQATIEACKSFGVRLSVWTVNSAEAISDLLDLGVRDIITDYPNIAIEVVEQKGFILAH